MTKVLLLLLLPFAILVACTKDDLEHGAVAELQSDRLNLDVSTFPLPTLSAYGFFKGKMVNQQPMRGVVPYEPINALFTDYAHKFRFVWMPAGSKATYSTDHDLLDFPDGTVLIKTFYYDHVQRADARRVIETRLLFKRNGQWEFANYVWNSEQTEASLDMNGSYTPITWLDDNGTQRTINYRIPSQAECLTCHKSNDVAVPIGPRPQNINSTFTYKEGPYRGRPAGDRPHHRPRPQRRHRRPAAPGLDRRGARRRPRPRRRHRPPHHPPRDGRLPIIRQQRRDGETLVFGEPEFYTLELQLSDVILGDFTGDGGLDIAVAHNIDNTSLDGITLFALDLDQPGGPVPYVSAKIGDVQGAIVALRTLDLDGDERDDLAVAVRDGSRGYVNFYANHSPGDR